METDISKKQHRKKQSGPKAVKKRGQHEQDLSAKQRNPKAFAVQSVNKTTRLVQRTLDIKSKKHHIPLVDRTPVEPPPIVVAIVGPPKVGKSTLLQCLVKNFTKQKLSNPQGPITVVSGKHRRLTLIECNNDINSMIDLAKVADLVLLLVDASFGFEMEIFEFLNICQVHGFPKIMGVLTHLDSFKDNKRLKKTKKRLKHRFWTEVYQGAKLFYLSGMVNGEYQKREVHNLCRFVSVMKFRPLQWRMAHPYVVADRLEDITDPGLVSKKVKSDRDVSLYGYVRGTHFKNQINVHIPGCGDYKVHDVQFLPDPCPTPDAQKKRRSLNEKERLIYSPMSGVGGVVYDKDAVYIDLGGSHSHRQTAENPKPMNELVSSMMSLAQPVDNRMTTSQVSLFSDTLPLTWDDTHSEKKMEDSRNRRQAIFNQQDDDDDDDDNDDDDESNDEIGDADDGGREENDTTEPENREDKAEELHGPLKKKIKVAKPVTCEQTEQLKFADSDDELENDMFEDLSNKLRRTAGDTVMKMRERTSHKTVDKSDREEISDEDSDSEESDSEESAGEESAGEESAGEESAGEESAGEETTGKESAADPDDSDDGEPPWVHGPSRDHSVGGRSTPPKYSQRTSSGRKDSVNDGNGDIYCAVDDGDESNESDDSEVEDIVKPYQTAEVASGEKEAERHQKLEEQQLMDDNQGDEWDETVSGDEKIELDQEEKQSGELQWKSNMVERAAESFRRRQEEKMNYRKLVYGRDEVDEAAESGDELGGLFTVLRKKSDRSKADRITRDGLDCSRTQIDQLQFTDIDQIIESIRDCFVTGKWEKSQDAETLLKQDDELFGDFEDLETGKVFQSKEDDDDSDDDDKDSAEGNGEKDGEKDEERVKKKAEMTANERRELKKRKLKERFDNDYDTKGDDQFYEEWKLETEQQAKLNREEFHHLPDEQRVQYEGFRPGMYVRVELKNVPCEFVTNFDPHYPVILGGLQNIEGNVGYVQARVKKHRWHKKILKTRNPLIVSLGWRRFQSIPLYYIQDHNFRNRLLKYTPEHLHCQASFWGPITPQGTGLLAMESVSTVTPGFRIAATGVVLELDKSVPIVKKLKLTGTPFKIFKKTAFIQGMFNSKLEVAKFEGASIRTVSGIRGQIKKALSSPEGAFRATFEDKILMSDLAFVRTWFSIQIPQFYNPVTSLLLPREQKTQWSGMKTIGQLRFERGVSVPMNKDSQYKPITRVNKAATPLFIPKHLQKELPFKDTPKLVQQKKADPFQRVSVIREPREAKVAKVMHMLKALHEHKMKKVRVAMRERAIKHQKETDKIEFKKARKQKEVKKEIYRVLGQIEKKKNKNKRD